MRMVCEGRPARSGGRSISPAGRFASLLILGLLAPTASGGPITTTRWAPTVGGAWADAMNWTNGVPTSLHVAIFNIGGTLPIGMPDVAQANSLEIDGDSDVTLSFDPAFDADVDLDVVNGLRIGEGAAAMFNGLRLLSGESAFASVSIATPPGHAGSLVLNDHTLACDGFVFVGEMDGDASLHLESQSFLPGFGGSTLPMLRIGPSGSLDVAGDSQMMLGGLTSTGSVLLTTGGLVIVGESTQPATDVIVDGLTVDGDNALFTRFATKDTTGVISLTNAQAINGGEIILERPPGDGATIASSAVDGDGSLLRTSGDASITDAAGDPALEVSNGGRYSIARFDGRATATLSSGRMLFDNGALRGDSLVIPSGAEVTDQGVGDSSAELFRLTASFGGALRWEQIRVTPIGGAQPPSGLAEIEVLIAEGNGAIEPRTALTVETGGQVRFRQVDPGSPGPIALGTGAPTILGGALVVENLVTPAALGDVISLIRAPAAASGEFEISVTPGFGDNRVLVPVYPSSGATAVGVAVVNVQTLVNLDPSSPTSLVTGEPRDVVTTDLNNDGFPDIAVALDRGVGVAGAVQILFNAGNTGPGGSWGGVASAVQVLVGEGASGIDAADFDADGDVDLVVSNERDDTFQILDNGLIALRGPGVPFMVSQTVQTADRPVDVTADDFDGDARPDVLVAERGADTVSIYSNAPPSPINGGATGFAFLSPITLAAGSDPDGTDSGDWDNDKDADPFAISDGPSSGQRGGAAPFGVLIVWENMGAGSYVPTEIPLGIDPADLVVADVNADTLLDALVSNRGSDSVSIVSNAALSLNAQPLELPVGPRPGSLASFRLDADDRSDLAVVVDDALGERVVRIYRNALDDQGSPLYENRGDAPIALGATLVDASDVNLDGREDLVVIGEDQQVLRGDRGIGPSVLALLNETMDLSTSDVDADGEVGPSDLSALLANWGPCPPSPTPCVYDFNRDGFVNAADLSVLLAEWS